MDSPLDEAAEFSVEVYSDRDAWLVARRSGIGGSDAPALWQQKNPLVASFGSPYSVWASKQSTGEEVTDEEEAEWLEIGREMEPVIASMYQRRTGRSLIYPGPTTILRSKKWPFMFVSVDRIIDDQEEGRGILECKNRHFSKIKDWSGDSSPIEVQIQVGHAMAVTGFAYGVAAAIVGGSRFRFQEIRRSEDFVAAHVDLCSEFWRLVESGTPPPVDGSRKTAETLARLFPEDNGESIALPPGSEEWDEQYRQANEMLAEAMALKTEAQNKIRAAMATASVGVLPSGARWSNRLVRRAAHMVEASESRTLRRSGK